MKKRGHFFKEHNQDSPKKENSGDIGKIKKIISEMCGFDSRAVVNFNNGGESMSIKFRGYCGSDGDAAYTAHRAKGKLIYETNGAIDYTEDFKREDDTLIITGESRKTMESKIDAKLNESDKHVVSYNIIKAK